MTEEDGRRATLRGRLVEGVRLIFVAVFGAVGYQLGTLATGSTGGAALLYVFLGAASGYVLGGVLGRLTLQAVRGIETEFARRPAAELAGGVVGGHPRARDRDPPVRPAAADPGAVRVAGDRVHLPGARIVGPAPGPSEVRGHVRVVRYQTARERPVEGGPPRRGHERPDRRAYRRPRLDGVHLRDAAVARRRPARAPGDLGLVRSQAPGPRPSRPRHPGRAPEGADGPVPARRRGGRAGRRRGAGPLWRARAARR